MNFEISQKFNQDAGMAANAEHEHRREPRYSYVGIPLIYSAVNDSHVKELGKKLHHAAAVDMSLSGLAFDIDVEQPLLNGDKILVLVDMSEEFSHEELMTEVRWCKELPSGQYQVGVVVDTVSKPILKNAIPEINFNAERTAPAEIEILCPACKKTQPLPLLSINQY